MTTEHWRQIKDVLHAALELSPGQRTAFLDRACPDHALRQEVESLLSSPDEALSSFFKSTEIRTLGQGTKLGDYEVQALLGAGGMGEVYSARDPRLNRNVAIKVLPRISEAKDHPCRHAARANPRLLARLIDGKVRDNGKTVGGQLPGNHVQRCMVLRSCAAGFSE
jgi:hypothetical protein